MAEFRLFHRTEAEWAESIIRDGFREDCNHSNLSNAVIAGLYPGVFLSDIPLGISEGAKGDVLIEVLFSVPEDNLSTQFEFIYECGECPYREFLVPAEFVNAHAKLRLLSGDEVLELELWGEDVRLQRANDYEQDQNPKVE